MIEKLLKLNPLCAKARPSPARPILSRTTALCTTLLPHSPSVMSNFHRRRRRRRRRRRSYAMIKIMTAACGAAAVIGSACRRAVAVKRFRLFSLECTARAPRVLRYQPPSDYRPKSSIRFRKIYVPVE